MWHAIRDALWKLPACLGAALLLGIVVLLAPYLLRGSYAWPLRWSPYAAIAGWAGEWRSECLWGNLSSPCRIGFTYVSYRNLVFVQ